MENYEIELLVDRMINRIEDIGRAKEKLNIVLDDDIFENLSKHDKYFHSGGSGDGDKLDELRRKLGWIKDQLWDVWAVLNKDG